MGLNTRSPFPILHPYNFKVQESFLTACTLYAQCKKVISGDAGVIQFYMLNVEVQARLKPKNHHRIICAQRHNVPSLAAWLVFVTGPEEGSYNHGLILIIIMGKC